MQKSQTKCCLKLNSPSAAYMRQWIRSALLQIMTCCLFGGTPLPACCQMEFNNFHSRKRIWNCCLLIWRPFCPGEMSSKSALLCKCQSPRKQSVANLNSPVQYTSWEHKIYIQKYEIYRKLFYLYMYMMFLAIEQIEPYVTKSRKRD